MKAADIELVDRCRQGDQGAFSVLVERYERPIFNVALRMLGGPEDAEDVTQVVFLKVWEHLDRYDPAFKFYSWVYRIAINESINRLGARRPDIPIPDTTPWEGRGPDGDLEGAELARTVQMALMAIKTEYRAVIVLRHFLGCSHRDTAEVLGIPEKTVKSRLFTARQQLKDLLVAQGIVRP